MGSSLVVTTLPDEIFSVEHLVEPVWNDETGTFRDVRISTLYDRDTWWRLRRNRAEMERRHPNAAWRVAISPSDVWYPPSEGEQGVSLHDKTATRERKRHAIGVRRSLEEFLNAKLGRLSSMLRTGWFIVEEVHVAVTKLTGRP